MKRWYPNDEVFELLQDNEHEVKGVLPSVVYKECEFYCAPWFPLKAITIHKKFILFDDDVYLSRNVYYQALVMFHELVHVIQQKVFPRGFIGFYVTYLWDWIRSGFSYQRMKKKGIEEEAIRNTDIFRESMYGFAKVDQYYAVITDNLYYAWLKKEPTRKCKRIKLTQTT